MLQYSVLKVDLAAEAEANFSQAQARFAGTSIWHRRMHWPSKFNFNFDAAGPESQSMCAQNVAMELSLQNPQVKHLLHNFVQVSLAATVQMDALCASCKGYTQRKVTSPPTYNHPAQADCADLDFVVISFQWGCSVIPSLLSSWGLSLPGILLAIPCPLILPHDMTLLVSNFMPAHDHDSAEQLA